MTEIKGGLRTTNEGLLGLCSCWCEGGGCPFAEAGMAGANLGGCGCGCGDYTSASSRTEAYALAP